MLARIINEDLIRQVRHLLETSDKIVITCHVSPDGDAIGSSLGLWHVLNSIGKHATVITPDAPPRSLMFLPGAKEILPYNRHTEYANRLLREAQLVFCLDFNVAARLDRLEPAVTASPAAKVMIDHHTQPGDFANVVISHPEQSSTSILLFRVLCRLELFDVIDRNAAECIYTGMMTDTGNFSYNSNDPDLYTVVAELLRKGINKDRLYTLACNTTSENALRLNGYAINEKMEIFERHQAALICLTSEELTQFSYEKGDSEGLVNKPLAIPTVTWSIYLRQDPDKVKVSMRSKGDFPVNKVCADHFGGGGHVNASGGEFYGSMQECVALLQRVMPDYDKYLPTNN
jgi:phosphoesterase RecJ-like protein